MDDQLKIERRAAALWMTLNRADKANALAVGMMEGAVKALRDAAVDDSIEAVVLTAAGERAFCAGVDVREQPADGDAAAHRKRRSAALAAFIDAVVDTPKPVVAALNGIASGGGGMLALLADYRVAVDSAAIALPEINLGISTFIGAEIAMEIGGLALATDLVQTGRRMSADEAFARGLLNRVVPRIELEAAAAQAAAELAGKDGKAFAANKAWLNRRVKRVLAEAREEHERHRKK
ncbi:MAG TPA: enoyl-CoA hydratase/isomerase family protein [Burkholderiales bacterium]|nr:enoyl-CoA hydratase/isomerase family protein [Burkholderiales bacterium]